MLADKIAREHSMNFDDLIRDWLRDPLGFFVLSYLVGAAMCGAWALAMEPLRRVRQDQRAHLNATRAPEF
jgi:hypothetical protein